MTWLLPEDSLFIWPALAMILWGIMVCLFGAILGIMFAFGCLKMGCPLCDSKSNVMGQDRNGLYLSCPACGDLRIKRGSILGLKVIRPGSKEDDLLDYKKESSSMLLLPRRHPVPFIILYLPVIASIVIASIIHEFTFFYVLIPGFWCYAVGCLIIDGIYSGSMSDNHGTALRSKSPIRFWGKIGIWFLFYLFAAASPVGFAIQERNKAATEQFSSSISREHVVLAEGFKIEGISFKP